ncbi:MAG: serine O-acetyltransferase, partial [Rhizobiaceae bacterium]
MASKSSVRTKKSAITKLDPVWEKLRQEAQEIIDSDAAMSGFIYSNILNQKTLEDAVVQRVCERLHKAEFSADMIRGVFTDMRDDWSNWPEFLRSDIAAVYERDPACTRFVEPILYFKGFHAIQTHRLANWAWENGRRDFAL